MSSLVFDIETDGIEAGQVWCVSMQDTKERDLTSYIFPEIDKGLEALGEANTLIGHNIIGYDLPILEKLYGWVPEKETNIVDTLVLSRLGNPDRGKPPGYTGKGGPHSLEAWGYRLCRAKLSHEDWSVYSPAMLERNRGDVELNRLTNNQLSIEFEGHDWSEAIRIEHDVFRIIHKQSEYGVHFNVNAAEDLVRKLDRLIGRIDSEVVPLLPVSFRSRGVAVNRPFINSGRYSKMVIDWYPELDGHSTGLVGGPFTRVAEHRLDIGSIKQVKDYLLDQGWEPTQWNYNDDGIRTSPKLTEDSYGTIKGDMGEQITNRLLYSHRKNQILGWLKRVREDGRLSARANTCGTPTGRFRHSNVVNVPKATVYPKGHERVGELVFSDDPEYQKVPFGTEMRSLFNVPIWHRLVGHDADQIELRMLAHYMGDKKFIQEVLHGDIHTANQIAAGLLTRDQAKTFIYAFIYGAGDAKLGSIVGGDRTDGADLRAKFLATYPKLDTLIKRAKRAAGKGYLKGLDGRKLWIRRDDSGRLQRNKALNTLIQGGDAVVMKKSIVLLDDWTRDLMSNKVLDMHDEGQAEVFFTHAHLYGELACKSIVKAGEHFNLNCPLSASYKVGRNWAETH